MNKIFKTGGYFLLGTAFITSCNSASTPETEKEIVTVTDTIVQTETISVAEPIDTAAVVAYYEATHSTKKGVHQQPHKSHATKKGKMVLIDSHETIPHHDAMPVTTTPATDSKSTSTATVTKVVVVHDVQKVYFQPDESASFPGGEKAFDEYLEKNIDYPEEAIDRNVNGTVYAVVTLDEQGYVKKVDFPARRLGAGLNTETERVLMNSPRWNPAKHAGVPVKSKFTIPITYHIK